MPGPSPAPCTFPDDFVQAALETVRRRTVPAQVVQRFRLVLLLHDQPDTKNDKAAKKVGLSARQVQRWRSRWAAGDFSIEDQAGRGRKPVFSPSGSSVDPSDGVRDDRRDGRAPEPAIAC
jgi:Homeodomain-like domain